MGVPGYFSWVHRKFPMQVRKVKSKGNKKHIDCLYIDVNGICYQYARDEHLCNYLLNPKSLETIFKQIIDHIDSIIELVQPQLQVYLMLDGPCPRAKMNQQRQRRFHAQHNHVQLKEALVKYGYDVKNETVPNNSIAPGTPFMYELNEQIKRYIETRIALANDAMTQDESNHKTHNVAYRKLQFILSDSNSPGEGEHKILEVIRKHTNYQLTHCIVGADADLLLLSLATIGKRILILRENNKFKGEKGDMDQEMQKLADDLEREKENGGEHVKKDQEYDMVDINGLKRVILDKYKKMFDNKQIRNLKYNPMNIMDDFVFLSLFAGNDFIPRQNYMQIKNDKRREHILDILIDKYDSYLEDATTYLSDRGFIKFAPIIDFFKLVATIEPQFKKNNVFNTPSTKVEDKKVVDYVKIMSQKQVHNAEHLKDTDLIDYELKDHDLQLLQKHSQAEENELSKDLYVSDSDEEQKHDTGSHQKNHNNECKNDHHNKHKDQSSSSEEQQKKKHGFEENDEIANILNDEQNGKEIYLKEKLEVHSQNEYDLIIMKYLEGFQFTLLYYFRGIEKASWNYYYPHFYAPLTQDVVEFIERNPKFEVKFAKTQPFQPYKQLLAILHPDNNDLLPEEFKGLFKKYLLAYCPEKLDIDKYGATMDHMQIIKLPFIDLNILEQAYDEGSKSLSTSNNAYDKNRNLKSQDILFEYNKDAKAVIPVFNKLFHHTQIENAPVSEVPFNHLDVVLPEKITTLTVDIEKKDAERQRHEQNKNSKKGGNYENVQYERKDNHQKYRGDGDDEQEQSHHGHEHGNKEQHQGEDHHHKGHNKKDYDDESNNKHQNHGHHNNHHNQQDD